MVVCGLAALDKGDVVVTRDVTGCKVAWGESGHALGGEDVPVTGDFFIGEGRDWVIGDVILT